MEGAIEGAAYTFLALPRLTRVLASIPPGQKASVSISVNYMDHAAHQAITDWQRQYDATGGTVGIHGVIERATSPTDRPATSSNPKGPKPLLSWRLSHLIEPGSLEPAVYFSPAELLNHPLIHRYALLGGYESEAPMQLRGCSHDERAAVTTCR